MYTTFSVIDLLRNAAKSKKGVVSYTEGEPDDAEFMTYGQLWEQASNRASLLRSCEGYTLGRVVLIHFRRYLDNIVCFWQGSQ